MPQGKAGLDITRQISMKIAGKSANSDDVRQNPSNNDEAHDKIRQITTKDSAKTQKTIKRDTI